MRVAECKHIDFWSAFPYDLGGRLSNRSGSFRKYKCPIKFIAVLSFFIASCDVPL